MVQDPQWKIHELHEPEVHAEPPHIMSLAPDSLFIPPQNWHSSPKRVRKPKIFKQKTNTQICLECEHVNMKPFTSCSLQETCLGSLPISKCCQHGSNEDGLIDNPASFLTHWPPPARVSAKTVAICIGLLRAQPSLCQHNYPRGWMLNQSGENGSACRVTWHKL